MKKINLKTKTAKSAGITLIALVITIIVLLILAGISISMLAGDNSILSKATDAKEKSGISQAEERIKMSYNAALTEDLAGGKANIQKSTLEAELAKEFPESTISVVEDSSDSTKWIVTVDGVSVTVQAGVSTASEEDENTVESLAKAGTIKRWDKVNYKPGTKTTASISLPSGATIGGTISASSATDWVVLDVNESTGEVLIVPKTVSSTTLTLSGKDGYNNSLTALQAVADIYLNSAQASSVRSLTVDDVYKVEGHTPPNETVTEKTWNHRYGMDSNLNITDTGSDSNTPSQTYTGSTGIDFYRCSVMEGTFYCWLPLRKTNFWDNKCCFCVGALTSDGVAYDDNALFIVDSGGGGYSQNADYPVVPIVILKSDIQMENGAKFYTQTATATATVAEQDATHQFEHNTWNLK